MLAKRSLTSLQTALTGEEGVDSVDQQGGEDEDDHGLQGGGRVPPQALDPASQSSEPHAYPVEEACEEHELAGEQPEPDGDDDVARARRRDEHEASDYEYGAAQETERPPVSPYQALPATALVEVVAALVAVALVDLPEGPPVTPASPRSLDRALDTLQPGHRRS